MDRQFSFQNEGLAKVADLIARQPRSRRNRSGLCSVLLLLAALILPADAWAGNIKDNTSLSVTWNPTYRRIDIRQELADYGGFGGDSWFKSFDLYVDGKIVLKGTEPSSAHGGNSYQKYTLTATPGNGTVRVGYKTYERNPSIYWVQNPNYATTYFYMDDRYITMWVEYYPNDDMLGKTVTVETKCTHTSGSITSKSQSVTITNPLSEIKLENVKYLNSPDISFTVNRPAYNANNDNNNRMYLEFFKTGETSPYKSEGLYLSSGGKLVDAKCYGLTRAEITEGRQFRLKYERDYNSDYEKTKYTRTSEKVTLSPVKLPTNPRIEDGNCGKLKITWETESATQSSQAGDVRIYNSSNTLLGTAPYSARQYEYTIPASDIGKAGNKTYSFKISRDPFATPANDVVTEAVSFTKNMNYRTLSSFNLSAKSGKVFNLAWKADNGYYCSDYKYRIRVEQETENQGKESFVSSPIDITKTDADVNVTGANFNFCSKTSIIIEMIDGSSNVLRSANVTSEYVFVQSNVNSAITQFSVSKGFYAQRVQLDWTVNNDNQFAKYLVYRKVHGSAQPGNGTLVTALDHSSGVNSYSVEDLNAVPGTFYNYTVEGQMDCGNNKINTIATVSGVGYILPFGTVSGRISFKGSEPVRDVVVMAQGSGASRNKVVDFSSSGNTHILTPYKADMLSKDAFTFQAWVQIRDENGTSTIQSLMDAAGKYGVEIDGSNVWFSVYQGNDTQYTEYQFSGAEAVRGEYHHISVAYSATGNTGTAILYMDGQPVDTVTQTGAGYTFPTASDADKQIYFGRYWEDSNYLNGYMDELRLWNRALPAAEIAQNYNAYISGKENGLALYYRFDELDELNETYDLSGNSNIFNENHGVINGTIRRSNDDGTVPTSEQLSIKAVTDANGNYLINTIPYTGDGSTYALIPSLGEHNFDPSSRPLYFTHNSTVHNNIDFTDISSFKVRGRVVYEGGNYPVADCSFEIDGQPFTAANGTVVKSNESGEFDITVPIGKHSVRVVKTGHTFANGGYLKDAGGEDLKYNAPVANIKFEDRTKVKLIGRVTGGNTEDGKPVGFGEAVNNIGIEKIVLQSTQLPYDFATTPDSAKYTHNDSQWKKTGGLMDDDTTMVFYNPKDITIRVSPKTGEFVAMVYPESYAIQPITVTQGLGNPTLTVKENAENIDLSTTAVPDASYLQSEVRTWKDSVYISGKPGVVDHWEYVEKSDTVRYNSKWTYKYQATPTFGIKQMVNNAAVAYFGEKTCELNDELTGATETLDLYDENTGAYLFDNKPVFQQGKEYHFRFNAYEQYTNFLSSPPKMVEYPISKGKIDIDNNLQVRPEPETLEMDSLGILNYKFTAGAPNLTNATNNVFAILSIGAVSYYWNMVATGLVTGNDMPLEAWQLGEKTTGTNFMTSGPDKLSAILRDPPGTASYAYIEKGSTITSTVQNSIGGSVAAELNLTTSLGPKIITFVGLGAGVINENETKIDIVAGLTTETTFSFDTEETTTTTFTERFQTSDSPDYVGAAGDVFIGNSTNILYGLTNGVKIQKGAVAGTPYAAEGQYKIAPSAAIAYGQVFATRFAYTAMELENIMIPKWQNSIALRLKPVGSPTPNVNSISEPVYVSKLADTDPNYGKWNLDKTAFTNIDLKNPYDGESYKIYFPASWTQTSDQMKNFQDSILWANNQIEMWTTVLAQNEKEKVEMQHKGNYSFGGGASIEYSEARSVSSSFTSSFGLTITPTIGAVVGGEVMGIGLELETKLSIGVSAGGSVGESAEETMTTGFALVEEGTTDEITVDYGTTNSGTFAFKTRGGQTSCPYEDAVISKYYQPGQHILQEATMKIEVPLIKLSSASSVLNVPANRAAIFTLDLQNESETKENVWYQLVVDEASNPNGAILKIDGIGIGNGRTFLVKAGESLIKTLTLEKGTVDNYDNIGIILQSLCQPDEITDTTWITAHFVPACSDVAISQPGNNFIVNTESPKGSVLSVTLQNFDVNFPNFGYIRLEYRAAGETTWSTARTFYPDNLYPNVTDGTKENIRKEGADRKAIAYDWTMPTADGQYELRATTASVNINNNAIVGNPLSTYSTDVITGYKDMTKPQALGAPSPANGIYGAGDELSVTFNEDIQTAMVIPGNINVTYGTNKTAVPIMTGNIVVSSNKILFTYPSDYFAILEGEILDIEVKNIYDIHGNKSEPIKWTAFVNRNPLVWETAEINLVKQAGEMLTFNATIKNAGNQALSYSFANLPQWLSVNQSSGNLQPLQIKELTFTISSGVNLGEYTEQIGVTSGNGIVKKLPLSLRVTGTRPEGWSVNPGNYESTMTVTGRLQIEGTYQIDEADILAAFIGDECVGVTSPALVEANNDYYTFLTVFGNAVHAGKTVKFKIWDASTGNIYPVVESKLNNVLQNITFTSDAIKGSVSIPVIHNALNIVEQSIVLNNGWNWISVNVLNSSPAILQQFKDRVGPAGEMLKGYNGYLQTPSWAGTLTSLEKERMYQVKTNTETTLRFDGTPANPATSPITLANGWNWIGYIPQFTLPVNDALANLPAQTDDQIKGQTSYRTYGGAGIGWVGSLNYLRSGEGYMYNSGAAGKTFSYPAASSQVYRAPMRAATEPVASRWTTNVHKYFGTMTMTSIVLSDNVELQSDLIEIAAFDDNGECRGSIMLQNVPEVSEHPYIGFLMAFGEDEEKLTLKVYDHTEGREYTAINTINFIMDEIHGTPSDPYRILLSPTGIDKINIEQVTVYPNPVSIDLRIASYGLRIDNVKIYDALGRMIYITDAVQSSINVSGFVSGIYTIQIATSEGVVSRKFVKR